MTSLFEIFKYKFNKYPSVSKPISANDTIEEQFYRLVWTKTESKNRYLPKEKPILKEFIAWEKEYLNKDVKESIINKKSVDILVKSMQPDKISNSKRRKLNEIK